MHLAESERLCDLVTDASRDMDERRVAVRALVDVNYDYGVLSGSELEWNAKSAYEAGANLSDVVGYSLDDDDVATEYVNAVTTHLVENPEDAAQMADQVASWLIEAEEEKQMKQMWRSLRNDIAPPSPASYEGAYDEGDPKLFALRNWANGN